MAFFNDDDDEDESYKPAQKALPSLHNQNNQAPNHTANNGGTQDAKQKFSKLFGDDDEDEY